MAVAIFERMLYNVRNYLQKGVIIMAYSIRQAKADDSAAVAALAALLWHSATRQELEDEFREMAGSADTAVFLASEGETVCGFAQCSLRRDYVEGTHSCPVGYLEGIYVVPEYRNQGCAGALLAACENWALDHSCEEFASDCELTNQESLQFHLNTGFQEANRIICFTKKLSILSRR